MPRKFGLSKDEILRGHNAFKNVLDSSCIVNGKFITLFVQFNSDVNASLTKSPQVLVGFMLSKKKIPDAYKRNKIKRQLKEIYRTNKNKISAPPGKNLKILLAINNHSEVILKNEKKLDYKILEMDILKLFDKLNFNLK